MVEEVSELEKDVQVRVLSTMFDADESYRRELVDYLWSDPDRRYEFYEKCAINFDESEIHREVAPGIEAELTEVLGSDPLTRFGSEDAAAEVAIPRIKSLMEDAGAYKEFGDAAVKARVCAFIECILDYLEVSHT